MYAGHAQAARRPLPHGVERSSGLLLTRPGAVMTEIADEQLAEVGFTGSPSSRGCFRRASERGSRPKVGRRRRAAAARLGVPVADDEDGPVAMLDQLPRDASEQAAAQP
jgi:hypothetical protein